MIENSNLDTTTNDFIFLNNSQINNSQINNFSQIYIHTIDNITSQFKILLSTITTSHNNTLTSILNSNQTLPESSENVPLSNKNSPWPVSSHGSPCHLCHYYGHGTSTCSNITENVTNKCIRCFQENHLSGNCPQKEQSPIPFKKNYKSPSKFL